MESKQRKAKRPTASIDGPVWAVRHIAERLDMAPSFYRAHILTRDDHPPAINPSAGRWYWFRSQIEPWLENELINAPEGQA